MKPEDIKALIGYRLEEAQEALDDAKLLLDAGRPFRTIINRCYYAMLYAALALLQTIEKSSPKHSGVLSLFDQEFVLKGFFSKTLSRNFHRAFDLRQTTDYAVTPPLDQPTVTNTYQAAEEFITAVKSFLSNQGFS